MAGGGALLRSACLRVAAGDRPIAAGRVDRRHGSTPDRRAAPVDPVRLRISRQLDARGDPGAAQTGDQRRARRRRCRRDEGGVRAEPPDPARRLRVGAADCVRQCRQPDARPCGRAPGTDGRAARRWRLAGADRGAGARGERPAGGRRQHRRPPGCDRRRPAAALARLPQRTVPADQHHAFAHRAGVRLRPGARHGRRVRRRPGMVRDANRPGGRLARHRSRHERSRGVYAQGAADRAGDRVGRAGRRRDDAGAQPRQPREAGLRLPGAGTGRRLVEPAAVHVHAAAARRGVPPARGTPRSPARRTGIGSGALQPADRQLGRNDFRGGPSAAENERGKRLLLGPRQRPLSPELRCDPPPGTPVHARPTTRPPSRWRS